MEMNRNAQEEGMTLIEVMVASVILLVGILGIAALQIHAMRANAQAFDMTEGAVAIGDRIERVLAETWTDKVTGGDLAEGTHTSTDGSYTVTWTVVDATDGRSKTVNLTVSWGSGDDSHSISQVMVRAKQ
ncbi:type IV pilus modification PilV family protein [Desulfoluna butyratoxydans]